MTKMDNEEKILNRIPLEIIVFATFLAILALFVFDALTALFFFAGGSLSAASFAWLRRSLSRFLGHEKKKAVRSAIALYLFRLVLILAAFFIIISLFPRKIFAFTAGFSVIILVFLVETIIAFSRKGQWKA